MPILTDSSCIGLFELVQPDPLQLPQAEHFTGIIIIVFVTATSDHFQELICSWWQ